MASVRSGVAAAAPKAKGASPTLNPLRSSARTEPRVGSPGLERSTRTLRLPPSLRGSAIASTGVRSATSTARSGSAASLAAKARAPPRSTPSVIHTTDVPGRALTKRSIAGAAAARSGV